MLTYLPEHLAKKTWLFCLLSYFCHNLCFVPETCKKILLPGADPCCAWLVGLLFHAQKCLFFVCILSIRISSKRNICCSFNFPLRPVPPPWSHPDQEPEEEEPLQHLHVPSPWMLSVCGSWWWKERQEGELGHGFPPWQSGYASLRIHRLLNKKCGKQEHI